MKPVYCFVHQGQSILVFKSLEACRNSIFVSYAKLKPEILDFTDRDMEVVYRVSLNNEKIEVVAFQKGILYEGATHL